MKNKKILVIGSSNTDMTVKCAHLPAPGETVMGGSFITGPGGKGANQAVAAARLGGDVSFVCKVGRDGFGDCALKGYESEGIDVAHVLRSDQPSGVALILVDEKAENSIAVAPGANSDLTVADIESVADEIRSADILLLQLEIPVESVLRAAQIAAEAGVYVILNPAPACRIPEEIYPCLSLLSPNQTEISSMTGIDAEDASSARDAVRALLDKGVKNVIITMGSKGSTVYSNGQFTHISAMKVDAVDTTAAGDTFCGALAVGLSEGLSLEKSAVFATKASALAVQKMGAQSSIPYRKEII